MNDASVSHLLEVPENGDCAEAVRIRLATPGAPGTMSDIMGPTSAPAVGEFIGKDGLVDLHRLSDASVSAGLSRVPLNFGDSFAFSTIRAIRLFTQLSFQKRYIHRSALLETLGLVPGAVATLVRHLTSIRSKEGDGGWVDYLLNEATNERVHLLTMLELCQPNFFERFMIAVMEASFFMVFFITYVLFPRVAHRMSGYLEEEAIISYTDFLAQINSGQIKNVPAPRIAKEYWHLPDDATLRDVVLVIRADEAVHRDRNHHFADRIAIHKENLSYSLSSDSLRPLLRYRRLPVRA